MAAPVLRCVVCLSALYGVPDRNGVVVCTAMLPILDDAARVIGREKCGAKQVVRAKDRGLLQPVLHGLETR